MEMVTSKMDLFQRVLACAYLVLIDIGICMNFNLAILNRDGIISATK